MKHHTYIVALVALMLVTLTAGTADSRDDSERGYLEYAIAYPHARTGRLASPEAGEEREERLGVLARGVDWVARLRGSNARQRAFALLVLTAGESGAWDVRIHAGLPHPIWTQDGGKARCLGQLHSNKNLPPERWQALAGTDLSSTSFCLFATMRTLEGHMHHCRVGYTEEGLAIAFASYGNGGRCVATGESKARAARWVKAVSTGKP